MSFYPALDLANSQIYFRHADYKKIKELEQTTLTLKPYVTLEKKAGKIEIKIDGAPGVALYGKKIFDEHNLGPYIEELTYRIKPVANARFLVAKPGGTPIGDTCVSLSTTVSYNLNASSGMIPSGGGSFNVAETISHTRNHKDFDYLFTRQGDLIEWTYKIKNCFDESGYSRLYDPNNIQCLKTSYWNARFWGPWYFRYTFPKDVIGKVPEAALSSIAFATEAIYDIPEKANPSDFELEFEAKVAFITNEGKPWELDLTWTDDPSERMFFMRKVHKVFTKCTVPVKGTAIQSEGTYTPKVVSFQKKSNYPPHFN